MTNKRNSRRKRFQKKLVLDWNEGTGFAVTLTLRPLAEPRLLNRYNILISEPQNPRPQRPQLPRVDS